MKECKGWGNESAFCSEMKDSIHSNDMEGIVDESSEQLNSPYALYLNGIYGEPDVTPRIGNEYQAEIPDLIPECDRLKLINGSASSELELNPQNSSSPELPIPVMWTRSEKFKGFREAESENNKPVTSKNYNTKQKPKAEPDGGTKPRVIVLALPCKRNFRHKLNRGDMSLFPFPGCLGESWEDSERDRFLLGLYLLGKNLCAAKRLVQSKEMGDILCFYYGKFYRSSEYKRWADGRSLRSRRSVQGQKLLTGWRQQELISRISSHVSEECKGQLHEASRAFREENISLEDYVFALKDAVGIDMLIEAFGIGKGKKDLTSAAMEPPKINHVVSFGSEVPPGKAYSSLSHDDIIKFLTGGFRLSKARSGDLFWEAVWPRLLARGWHSEQPKDRSRNSLVFLIPGVKKFSRRRLVKGNHYFDSVSDVLNRVALEPALLELETEGTRENENNEENAKDTSVKEDVPDDSPSNKRHRYLQPRSINENRDVMKFTIVDTSMFDGVERRKIRELRSLPVESASVSTISSGFFPSESVHDTSEESENEVEVKIHTSVGLNSIANTGKSKSVDVSADNTSRNTVLLDEKRGKNRKMKTGNVKYLSAGTKRNSLISCVYGESSCRIETVSGQKKSKNKGSHLRSNSPDAYDMMGEYKDQTQKLSSASSFTEGSSNGRKEGETSLKRDASQEKPGPSVDFDLNVPQVSPDFEGDEPIVTVTVQNDESSCANQSSVQGETSTQSMPQELPNGEASNEQQTNRRQSTRSRPLTTKALEAFAFGLLGSPKKKRKDHEGPGNNSRPRSSRRPRGHTVVTAEFRTGGNDGSNPNVDGLNLR